MGVFSAFLDVVGSRDYSSRVSLGADVSGRGREETRRFVRPDPFRGGAVFAPEKHGPVFLFAHFFAARSLLLFGCRGAYLVENVCVAQTSAGMGDFPRGGSLFAESYPGLLQEHVSRAGRRAFFACLLSGGVP